MRLSINELSSDMVVHCLFCARNDEKLLNELHSTVCDIFVRVEFCGKLNVYPLSLSILYPTTARGTVKVLFQATLIFYSV